MSATVKKYKMSGYRGELLYENALLGQEKVFGVRINRCPNQLGRSCLKGDL